jgi:hypothetical protein
MRRQTRLPRPPGWVIHSTFITRRDGPRRLEQAFEILLGSSPPDQSHTSSQDRREPHESGDLRPSLDRQAGA